jgi:hypothetical protein
MTDEQIFELASQHLRFFEDGYRGTEWSGTPEQLLKFAQAIIEEYEKDREHNLGKDEYFNSWKT